MKPMLSICLCSYNDCEYLELLFKSIYTNTTLPFEICITDNASTDDTVDLIREYYDKHNNFHYRLIHENEGVQAVNKSVEFADGKYIVNINSDMCVFQNWDAILWRKLLRLELNNKGLASVSACLVEPHGGNPEYYHVNLGTTPNEFSDHHIESSWLQNLKLKSDTIQFSHPIMMSRKTWDMVGGITENYYPFPGMCTDVDLGFKLLSAGAKCVMCGDALVYHFSSATLNRMRSNGTVTPPGTTEFIKRWGAHPDKFYEQYKVRSYFEWPQDR